MNKIKYALRFLFRQKAFTLINILGLTLSLTCGIVISRYLYREVTAESHAIDPETIIVPVLENQSGRNMRMGVEGLGNYYGKSFTNEYQKFAIESSKFIMNPRNTVILNNQNFEVNVLVVDSLFLHFFDYKIEGDRTAMARPEGCWVSRKFLQKLGLNESEAIGTSFQMINYSFVIAGIFEDPVGKTIFTPDMIVSVYTTKTWTHVASEWIRIPKNFDLESFNAYMKPLQQDTTKTSEGKIVIYADGPYVTQFIRWSDVFMENLQSNVVLEGGLIHYGNAQLDWILLGVMALILIVGVLNFSNLYLVYWQHRQQEQGVRRVFGQKPLSLFVEMGLELFISTALAVLLAWLLVNILKPWTDEILNDTVTASPFDTVLTVVFLVVVPLVSLCYPFIKQLRSSTLVSLQQRVGSVQNLRSRTVMLAFQYFIAFTLVSMAIWMQRHLDFLQNSPVGCDVENILITNPLHIQSGYVPGKNGYNEFKTNGSEVEKLAQVYLTRLNESPLVEIADVILSVPVFQGEFKSTYINDKGEKFDLDRYDVNRKWFDIFGVKLKEGKLLEDGAGLSQMNPEAWIVDEKALHLMGYKPMEDAYIKAEKPLIYGFDTDKGEIVGLGNEMKPISGIIEDHYRGHRTLGVEPSCYLLDETICYNSNGSRIAIRVKPGHEKDIIELLENTSAEVCPDHELEYHWFREDVEALYKEDKLMAQVYTLFSGIAILICCLGLLGLSLFDIRQRYREIAIRKANGAHRKDLYLLLGKKYLWVLLSTFVLSIPASYLLIHRYTQEFLECAPITIGIYMETLIIVVLITVVALSYQLEKAARVNVAAIIKSE